MKTSVAGVLCAGVLVAAFPPASRAEGIYLGANYARFQYVNDDYDDDEMVEPDAVVVRVGIEPADWLGLEARGGLGLDEDTQSIPGLGEVSLEIDEFYGAYARLGVPAGETLMPYVIGGYTRLSASGEAVSFAGLVDEDIDEDWDDASYGAGLDVNLSETVALNLEYMRYLDDGPEELSAIAVGLRSAF